MREFFVQNAIVSFDTGTYKEAHRGSLFPEFLCKREGHGFSGTAGKDDGFAGLRGIGLGSIRAAEHDGISDLEGVEYRLGEDPSFLDDECKQVVKKIADEKHCRFYELDGYQDLGERRFVFHDNEYELTSYASYQLHNASLALYGLEIIADIENFNIDLHKAQMGLKQSLWHCRFEIVKEKPLVILDGAHNIHGIEALCASFDHFSGSRCIIFSALKRKEYKKMADLLKFHCDRLIITTFDNHDAIDPDELQEYEVDYDYIHAIDEALGTYDNILICGSLYFMSEVVLNYKF